MFDIPFSSFRINIDLKVANEGMKSELAEKTQLLRQAHNAMERFEQERLREKAEFESQIVSLKQTLYESQQTGTSKSGDATGKSFAPCGNILQDTTAAESNNVPIGERTHNLLTDAFGSINLGKSGGPSVQAVDEDNEANAALKDKIDELQNALKERNEKIAELEEKLEDFATKIDEKDEELSRETKAFDKMTSEFHAKINELQEQVEMKMDHVQELQQELEEIQERLKEKEEECSRKSSLLNQSTAKLNTQIEDLQQMVQEKDVKIAELKEEVTKNQLLVKGVMDASVEQVRSNEKMAKELALRDRALQVLKTEYESLKKRHRAKGNSSSLSNDSLNNQEAAETIVKLTGQVDELKRALDEAKAKATAAPSSSSHSGRDEDPSDLKRKIALLQEELGHTKAVAAKRGARKALEKAKAEFYASAEKYDANMRYVVEMTKKRLRELVDFITQLLSMENEGLLDFSSMSVEMRDALNHSLNESRRLSQSLSQSMMISSPEDLNETQKSSIQNIIELPEFVLPNIEEEHLLSEEETGYGDKLSEYEALIAELKDNVRTRISAEEEVVKLRTKVDKLQSKLEYDRFSRPLSRSRSRSQSRNSPGRVRQRRDAPCQTSVQNDPNDSWSEPDKQESARRMGLKSKIPVANNSNLAVADAAGENCVLDESESGCSEVSLNKYRKSKAKVLQLRARLASNEERANREMAGVREELNNALLTIAALKEEKKTLTSQLTSIKNELDDNVARVMEELEKVTDSNRNSAKKIKKLEVEKRNKEVEIDECREKLQVWRSEREAMQLELEHSRKQMSEVVTKFNEEKIVLEETACQRVRELEEHISSVKDLVKTLERDLSREKESNKVLEAKFAQEVESTHTQGEKLKLLVEEKEKLLEKLNSSVCVRSQKENSAHRAVFVSKENFEEHELALGHRQVMGDVTNSTAGGCKRMSNYGCDCQTRIEELERLLSQTKDLYDGAKAQIEAENERKKKFQKQAVNEVLKTKKVIKMLPK